MFNGKWLWAIAAPVVLLICGFVFFRTRVQEKPVKTYKMVTPTPKTRATTEINAKKMNSSVQHGHGHDHDYPHDIAPHSHNTEPTISNDTADWRDDNAFDGTLPKSDPWKQTYSETESTDVTDKTYPPRDWHKTKDPKLFIEYFQAQLIKQFGDIKEVHIIVDREEKRKMGIPVTLDEQIVFLEAQYSLWQDINTLKTLEKLQKVKADTHTYHQEH